MKKLLLLVFFFYSVALFSQQKIYTQLEVDSIIALKTYKKEDMVKLKEMLESNEDFKGWGTYYAQMSSTHYNVTKKIDSSKFYGKKTIEYLSKIPVLRLRDSFDLMKANYYMGASNGDEGQFITSTGYFFKSLDIAKRIPDKKVWIQFLQTRIASNHLQVGDAEKALALYKINIQDSVYMKNPYAAGSIYNRLGVAYGYLKKEDSAKMAYKQAIEIYDKNEMLTNSIGPHHNLGDIYFKEGEVKKAIFHYSEAKKIGEDNNINNGFMKVYSAYLSIQKNEVKKGKEILTIVLDSLSKFEKYDNNSKDLTTIGMDFLALAHRKEGRLDRAYSVLENKNLFLEKFHDQMMKEKIQELNTQYDVNQKDQSISYLTATNEEQKTIIKQRGIITFILGGLLVAFIAIGTLIMRQRKLNAKYKTVNLEQRLLRSQLNPHFVYNALNTVSLLAQAKSEKTVPYILKFGSLMRLILENSREEFVVLSEELAAVNDYLELESDFSKKFEYDITVQPGVDLEGIFIPPMFIQPFIENAIAHGISGMKDGSIKLNVQLDEKAHLVECTIIDNGIGFNESLKNKKSEHNSLSGKILKERLDLYSKSMKTKARYTIDSSKEKGTQVVVYLPYYYEE